MTDRGLWAHSDPQLSSPSQDEEEVLLWGLVNIYIHMWEGSNKKHDLISQSVHSEGAR